ncbi:MAG TPA: glycosyltransferase family 4 protein [Acidobacteriota bacterium]|jgi:glycosyltransferase involved in cell wall biosynthesis
MLAYTFYENDNRVRRYAETLAKRGDHVDVIALRRQGQGRYEVLKQVNVYRIQQRVVNEKQALSYLIRLLRFFVNSAVFLAKQHLIRPYDLIHVHSVPDFEVFAALLPKLTRSKVILDIHDIVPEFYASKFNVSNTSLVFRLLILVERLAAAFSDHVIVSNHLWKERLITRSVPENKCSVVLNYPDPSIFHGRQAGKKGTSFIMIYPGTLNWHQGLDIAIRAFAAIREEIPQAEFHIYGEGAEKTSLINLAAKLGLQDKVLFKTFLPIEEIADVMASAAIGVVPKRASSFGDEAFSTKILEFMALGIPVIVPATRVDRYYFNDAIVRFFEAGNVDSLAESMLLLSNDGTLRRQLVDRGLEFIRQNNWEVKRHEYISLIDRLASIGAVHPVRRATKGITELKSDSRSNTGQCNTGGL